MKLTLYIGNRPSLPEFEELTEFPILESGDIVKIIAQCGNHWRKIFSIFAKLGFALNEHDCKTWQEYRDQVLLTVKSSEHIVFDTKIRSTEGFHIICGQSHFELFDFTEENFISLDQNNKVQHSGKIIQTPYFDYRQFNNDLIDQVISYCQTLEL